MDVILNVAPYCLRLSNVQKMSKSEAIFSNIIFYLHNMRNMSTIYWGKSSPEIGGKGAFFRSLGSPATPVEGFVVSLL